MSETLYKKGKVYTMTKMTYVTAIENAIAMFSQGGQVDPEDQATVERLQELIVALNKRNKKGGERKPTKTQKENAVLSEDIWAYVSENGAKRAMEVGVYFGISGQKASALLNALVKGGRLDKFTEKGATYFRVPEGM